jgi:hypothetical protein
LIPVQNVPDPMVDCSITTCLIRLTRIESEIVVVLQRLDFYNKMESRGTSALRNHVPCHVMCVLLLSSTIQRYFSKHSLTNGQTGYCPEDYR